MQKKLIDWETFVALVWGRAFDKCDDCKDAVSGKCNEPTNSVSDHCPIWASLEDAKEEELNAKETD